MNLNIEQYLPEDFHPNSRVWIYQSNRLLSLSEAIQVEDALNAFVEHWKSHGTAVKGFANLLFGQFIIIIADESDVSVGGCSTDSSVRLIKSLEENLQVSFFDRLLLAFHVKEKIQLLPLSQVQYGVDNGFITKDTPYFNNTVATLHELLTKWIIPVQESWLGERITFIN